MRAFERLIGEWRGEAELPTEPPMSLRVVAEIQRLGALIVFTSVGEPDERPDSISIIGGAPDGEPLPMHQFDSRGIKRLFMTTVDDLASAGRDETRKESTTKRVGPSQGDRPALSM